MLDFDPDSRTFSLGPVRSEADKERVAGLILDHLRGLDEAKTEPEINEAIEGRVSVKRAALRELAARGRITRLGSGRRGDPFRYEITARVSPESPVENCPDHFSFSCSQDMLGTREQETQKQAETRINSGSILVPDFSDKSFLVPENAEPEFDEGNL